MSDVVLCPELCEMQYNRIGIGLRQFWRNIAIAAINLLEVEGRFFAFAR
jgi:hypothetical protein